MAVKRKTTLKGSKYKGTGGAVNITSMAQLRYAKRVVEGTVRGKAGVPKSAYKAAIRKAGKGTKLAKYALTGVHGGNVAG